MIPDDLPSDLSAADLVKIFGDGTCWDDEALREQADQEWLDQKHGK